MKEVQAFDLEELHKIMEDKDIDNLSQVSNAAHQVTCNHGGEVILVNTTGEAVFFQEVIGDMKSNIKEFEIKHKFDGRPVFDTKPKCNTKYINNYLRNDYGRRVK